MKKPLPKRILVLKHRAIGDSLISVPTICYTKDVFSNAFVVYGVPHWIAPLYDKLSTSADEIIPLDFSSLKGMIKTWKLLKSKKFDLIIELHQNGRTGKFFKLFSLIHRCYYFFHNHHRKDKTYIVDQGIRKPAIQRDLDGVYSIAKFFIDDPKVGKYLDYPPEVALAGRDPKPHTFVLGMVATRETKMWSIRNFYHFILRVRETYPDAEFLIPFSKGEVDQKLKRDLMSCGPLENIEIVEASLGELPERLSEGSVYVGNDTGIKHLCVAMGMRTYTIFGPEEPIEWHPYNEKIHHFFFRTPLACRTKNSHYCGLNHCDSMICMESFTPDEVWAEVSKHISM